MADDELMSTADSHFYSGSSGARKKGSKPKPARKWFRVWFRQINGVCIDVPAEDRQSASIKASRKWRRGYSAPSVTDVREI